MKPPADYRGPWCSIHGCHPNDCFEIHYPNSITREEYVEDDVEAHIREHVRRQNENILREAERQSRSVVDARRRFEEDRDKRRKGA